MKICYVDEAGCTGVLPTNTSPIQPVLVICALFIDVEHIHDFTDKFIRLKQQYFPRLAPNGTTHLGWMLREVKGADLRKNACDPTRNVRRHTMRYLDGVLKIAEDLEGRIVGRVWVKGISRPINGVSVYTYSTQSIYADFQNYLERKNDVGVVIVDSRLKHLNTPVAHSIFTQKFKQGGDAYSRILELPAFSHSDNHAGLQIVDTICSALITPIAVHTYCTGHVNNIHVRPGYADIKTGFASRCALLQHRYTIPAVGRRGGLIVSDELAGRPGRLMFV